MLLKTLKLLRNTKCLQLPLRRWCRISINLDSLHSKFSEEQQKLILNTINQSDVDHLSQLGIPLNRIKNIKTWQHKRGSFKNLVDILEVDGLGIKVLEKICTNIISNNIPTTGVATTKNRKQYLLPPLTKEVSENISNAIGLHLGAAGISWAKVSTENQLLNWNFFKFNETVKKPIPSDTFKLVQTILLEIPSANLYIFEQLSHRTALGTSQNISHNHNLEILSMLLALINTSPVHNLRMLMDVPNCVYYLRSNLSARLFRTLMGTERVSSMAAVNRLMEGDSADDFPCKVKVDHPFKEDYLSKNAIGKELLGQALLLAVAFMEVCVHKNPNSLAIISRSKKVLDTKK